MKLKGYRFEYRINKNNCECFRTDSETDLADKLAELKAKHPNTNYTVQQRDCATNKYGVLNEYMPGKPSWTPWR